MKFFVRNPLAFSPDLFGPAGKVQRINELILDASDLAEKAIRPLESRPSEARLIDAMKKRGSKRLATQQAEKRGAFEQQIKSHLDSSFQFARRLTGNPDLAEELVQETMLRAVKNWESFRQQSQFKTWLFRILINTFHDQNRRNSKHDHGNDEPNDIPSPDPSANSQAQAKELNEIVNHLIAQLPQRQKEVLILSTYHSLTNLQIAETLEINVANVHANLSTARKRLKEQLEPFVNPS